MSQRVDYRLRCHSTERTSAGFLSPLLGRAAAGGAAAGAECAGATEGERGGGVNARGSIDQLNRPGFSGASRQDGVDRRRSLRFLALPTHLLPPFVFDPNNLPGSIWRGAGQLVNGRCVSKGRPYPWDGTGDATP
jgi:hypothetical protein